ncbi:response regulator transcription factor [Brevundimonas viscosa]|uniref:Response regulator receiver domain-containing protein n=1 Tax=Brevundimonas viscosa TaxID=871741 RepID=A0A1I6T3H0_9CAUL|nr:response regulator [Brevundimonas viscosa]SFS83683.1 Response regulator receiver domain-containing protein [Brevundimonas viscosa]
MTGTTSPLAGPAVVLVEGDPAVTHAIEFAFGLEGLEVSSYPSGADTLASERPRAAGCLVVDYKLPDMDGLELLEQLRAKGVSAPAILIATNPRAVMRQRALAAGAPIVEMPLLNDGLLDTVKQALGAQPGPC